MNEDKLQHRNCDSCRAIGSLVFFGSSGYMLIESARTSARSGRAFYAFASAVLAGLGAYRLQKPDAK
jgi:hypothetical protein